MSAPPTSPAVPEFNPFLAVPYLRSWQRRSSLWLAMSIPFLGGVILLVTGMERTFGGLSDFQPWSDLRTYRTPRSRLHESALVRPLCRIGLVS